MSKTEMYYDMLLGHVRLYDESIQLNSLKEVADFIHTHDYGYITEADDTPLLKFENGEIKECADMRFKDELMTELRKGEDFEDNHINVEYSLLRRCFFEK